MRHHTRSILAIAALSIGGAILSGCFDDADANSNLEARVAALEAQQHRVITVTAAAGQAKALDANLAAIGTLISFDGPPSGATAINARSAQGYLFTASLETGTIHGPSGSAAGVVRFLTTDCSGQAFVGAGDISGYAARQGLVFRMEQQDGSDVYYAVPTGTEALDPATYGSLYVWGAGCTTQDAVLPAFPLVDNDPATTGVDNAPAASITVG